MKYHSISGVFTSNQNMAALAEQAGSQRSWTYQEKEQLSQLKSEGKTYDEIGEILSRTTQDVTTMNEHLTKIKLIINAKLLAAIQACGSSVNIKNITQKLQSSIASDHNHAEDLSHKFWQTFIAETMAKTLTDLNFQERKRDDQKEETDATNNNNNNNHSNADSVRSSPTETEELVSEPGAELKNNDDIDENGGNEDDDSKEQHHSDNSNDNNNNTDEWIRIQRDLEALENNTTDTFDQIQPGQPGTKGGAGTNAEWDAIPIRWKTNRNFKVEPGITTIQITKTGGAYCSIVSLEPMMARKFKYTFMLSNIRERGKPWMGIGIISSKCPMLSNNRSISWHASNQYSMGWYYGTDVWHNHAPLLQSYGKGSYWKSGDEIEMIVDCKNYTLQYKLNGDDLGIAVRNFNKLMDSGINDRYYVIISIQQTLNSVTLMDAYRYREDRKQGHVNMNVNANDSNQPSPKWKSLFNPFQKKSKENNNNNNNDNHGTKARSKTVDVANSESNPGALVHSKELEALQHKLDSQNALVQGMKSKYDSLLVAYRELDRSHRENERKCKKLTEEMQANQKELELSRGVMHALKKLTIHDLHDLEKKLLSSLQNVQKAIALQYENKYDCRICMAREKDTVLIPCGHFLCNVCVGKVEVCPLCRANIDNTVQLN